MKDTLAPLTGLLKLSTTVARKAMANCVPICALCGVPPVALMLAAAPARLVKEKLALSEPVVAVTAYAPPIVFALKTGVVAMPDESVVAVNVTG